MPRKPVSKVDLVVTVADSHRAGIAEVAARLKAAGMGSLQTLHGAGLITGNAEAGAVARLGKVAGVQAVEASGEVHIAPPESDVQ